MTWIPNDCAMMTTMGRVTNGSVSSSCDGDTGDVRGVANSVARQSILTGEDGDFEMLAKWQVEALLPVKDDLADWLCKVLGEWWTLQRFPSYKLIRPSFGFLVIGKIAGIRNQEMFICVQNTNSHRSHDLKSKLT